MTSGIAYGDHLEAEAPFFRIENLTEQKLLTQTNISSNVTESSVKIGKHVAAYRLQYAGRTSEAYRDDKAREQYNKTKY